MTPELAIPSPNFSTIPAEGRLSFDGFNVHRPPKRSSRQKGRRIEERVTLDEQQLNFRRWKTGIAAGYKEGKGRITGFREGGFSYRAIGVRMQRNSSTVMRVWKQWTDEHQTTRKTGSGRRKVTSARNDRHLLHVAENDHTASPRQLEARWSTATGVLMQVSLICRRLLHQGLSDHDSRIRVRYYAGERCLPECVIERHSDLTPRVIV
ncbi:transposable element Tc1 transposase [Trichonephila clavipes]|nr:transposable element Tc1 transposase [Trichonephila clavipes]